MKNQAKRTEPHELTNEVNKLLDNFSSPSRITFSGKQFFIRSMSDKKDDLAFAGFFSLLILAFIIYCSFYTFSYLYLRNFTIIFVFLFTGFAYICRADNVICIDFTIKQVIIKKRTWLLRFIPAQIIPFEKIHHFEVKREVTDFVDTVTENHTIYLIKKNSFLQKRTLVSFNSKQKNDADQLLSFLKKTIIQYLNIV